MTKYAKQKIGAALLDPPETLVALTYLYKVIGLEIRLDSGDENVVAEDIFVEKNEKNEIINEEVNYKEDEDHEAEAEFTVIVNENENFEIDSESEINDMFKKRQH